MTRGNEREGGRSLRRNLRRWVPVAIVLGGLSLGVGATTYDSVDELPIPDIVISDRFADAEVLVQGGRAPTGWYDLREVHGFITDDGIAFAVFCRGRVPSDLTLVIFVNVDGQAGSIGRQPAASRVLSAGYDYWIGVVQATHGGRAGVFRLGAMAGVYQDPALEWWREGKVAYFEARWNQLGGRPESVTLYVSVADSDAGAWDYAPDRGKLTFEIP